MPVQRSGSRLSFGIIAEIHHGAPPAEPVWWHNELRLGDSPMLLRRAVEALGAEALDGLVLLGDLTNAADEPSLTHVLESVSAIDAPLYVVPGNHDIDGRPDAPIRFSAITEPFAARVAPAEFDFCPGLEIALLTLQRDRDTGGLASGSDWRSLASGSGPLLVFTHFPVLPLESRFREVGLKHAGDLTDRIAVHEALMHRTGPVIVIHGHLHVRDGIDLGPLLQLSCAALVEPPHEVSVINVGRTSAGDLCVYRRCISVEPWQVERLPVLAADEESWLWSGSRWQRI